MRNREKTYKIKIAVKSGWKIFLLLQCIVSINSNSNLYSGLFRLVQDDILHLRTDEMYTDSEI